MNPEVFGSFNNEKFFGSSHYQVDHRIDQRYRDNAGVRVYESGRVVLINGSNRDPDVRQYMQRDFGVNFEHLREKTNVEYFLPDGTPIQKSWIEGDCYLYDEQHGMVLNWFWAGLPITYYGAHAMPTGGEPITVNMPDKVEAKLLYKLIKPTLDLALTFITMSEGLNLTPYRAGAVAEYIQTVRQRGEHIQVTPASDSRLLHQLGEAVKNKRILSIIEDCTITKQTFPHLLYKEKK